jgi:hypothetical protein
MKYFTLLWRQDTLRRLRNDRVADGPMFYVAGNQFSRRGVEPRDRIFVLGTKNGAAILIGALNAGPIMSTHEVRRHLNYEPWEADEHILAEPASGTRIDFEDVLPLELVRGLQFISGNSTRGLLFRSPGKIDQQTLRAVRQLTPDSAEMLDRRLRSRL